MLNHHGLHCALEETQNKAVSSSEDLVPVQDSTKEIDTRREAGRKQQEKGKKEYAVDQVSSVCQTFLGKVAF